MKQALLCGDCAADARAHGAKPDEAVSSIAYGGLCTNHPPGLVDRQATSALLVPDDWAPSWYLPPSADGEKAAPTPTKVGPLTEITSRLVVAWTTEDQGAGAASGIVANAVTVARLILEMTGGA